MTTFTAACIQNCATDDLNANLERVEAICAQAAAAGADLLCMPEFYCCLESSDGAYYRNGHAESEHPALQHARDMANRFSAWLLLGSVPIRSTDGKVCNRSFLMAPDGALVARYDKIHLFDVAIKDGQEYKESHSVTPGSEAVVADLPWGRLGLSICYDVRFAYLYRTLAKAGADFITIPAAFTAKTGAAHWHTLVRARAIETGCYVIAPGQCGVRPWGRRTYGHSLIVNPWGEILADGGEAEGYILAEIDTAKVAEARTMIPALSHDRVVETPAVDA